MKQLRIIGDLHGNFSKWMSLTENIDYSIQVGDFSIEASHFEKAPLRRNPQRHKILGGNHDNYNVAFQCPNFLPDYGYLQIEGYPLIFFVRGAWSIDKGFRTPMFDWWQEEELNYSQMTKALEMYEDIKPEIMISHEAPTAALDAYITADRPYRSMTQQLLQNMFEIHQPQKWYYGHWHIPRTFKVGATKFRAMGIDDASDL